MESRKKHAKRNRAIGMAFTSRDLIKSKAGNAVFRAPVINRKMVAGVSREEQNSSN